MELLVENGSSIDTGNVTTKIWMTALMKLPEATTEWTFKEKYEAWRLKVNRTFDEGP